MVTFRIFTESQADVKFLRDYIQEVFDIRLNDEDFDTLGSWSGYKTGGNLKASIKQNAEDSKTTILILDADSNFNDRHQEVVNDFARYNIPISLFLFPNNNASGSLENALCETATQKQVIQCFEEYEICIAGYQTPVIKSKIFAYLDALLPAVNKKNDKNDLIQEKNRDYRNVNHWDLTHAYLIPLREFLTPFFNAPRPIPD